MKSFYSENSRDDLLFVFVWAVFLCGRKFMEVFCKWVSRFWSDWAKFGGRGMLPFWVRLHTIGVRAQCCSRSKGEQK